MARSHHQCGSELKQRLVEEIEAGQLSLREAARDARTSVAMVQVWLREYGRFQPKRDIVEVVTKSEQDRIAALEKALAEAHLKLQVYDELITQANKRYKTDFKRKLWYATAGAVCSTETGPSLGSVCHLLGVTHRGARRQLPRVDAAQNVIDRFQRARHLARRPTGSAVGRGARHHS